MKIFLGYASERIEVAREVVAFLEGMGHEVWFDKRSIIGGVEWDRAISSGHEDAQLIIHLCSVEILSRRGWVNKEIKDSLALYELEPIGSLLIVPLRLDPIHLPFGLARFQQIDYFEPDWKDRLIAAISAREQQLRQYPNYLPAAEQLTVKELASDVRRIEISDSTDSYDCLGAYLEYGSTRPYWRLINSQIASEVLASYLFHRQWFTDIELPLAEMKASWELSCQEFFRFEEIVSVRLIEYVFSGGVHGNTEISSLNFLPERSTPVEVHELFDDEPGRPEAVFNLCGEELRRFFDDRELPLATYEEVQTAEDPWMVLRNYNIDERGLTFNFSPYAVLSYAYGSSEVTLTWDSVSELLSPFGIDTAQRVSRTHTK